MSRFDPKIHHRHSIRLEGYNYSQAGAYFITLVTYLRQNYFGEVIGGEMKLNEMGQIAQVEWFTTARLRANIDLHQDEFIVMPNHVHGIIRIINHATDPVEDDNVGAQRRCAPTDPTGVLISKDGPSNSIITPPVQPGSLGAIVRAYKSAVTYAINRIQDQRGAVFWQRNYYEKIIRNENDFQAARNYILNNPIKWEADKENNHHRS